MKKIAIVITLLFFFLCSCNKGIKQKNYDNLNIEILNEQDFQEMPLLYNNKVDIDDLKEQKLSDLVMQLNLPYWEQMTLSKIYDIDMLISKKLVGVLRYNHGVYYSIARIKYDKYLFLLYEINDNITSVIDGFLVSTLPDKDFFNETIIGMRKEEILSHDPSACTIFEDCSYHRFQDKSILKIEYELIDNLYIVSNFQFLEDQESMLDYLLWKDLEKILPN